jgi:hypothetical protein
VTEPHDDDGRWRATPRRDARLREWGGGFQAVPWEDGDPVAWGRTPGEALLQLAHLRGGPGSMPVEGRRRLVQ